MNGKIYRFGGEGQDQRLLHLGKKVYVFDWSGDSPSSTDDGPLRAIEGSVCTLTMVGKRVHVSVPVWSERFEEQYSVWMGIKCFEKLSELLPGLSLDSDKSYDVFAADVIAAERLRAPVAKAA